MHVGMAGGGVFGTVGCSVAACLLAVQFLLHAFVVRFEYVACGIGEPLVLFLRC